MKKAITTTIVSRLAHLESANAGELSEYLKMPLGKCVNCLFELVDQGILDFDSKSYKYSLGSSASEYIVSSELLPMEKVRLEPFQAIGQHLRISSCEELSKYLRMDEFHYSECLSYHTFRVAGKKRKKLTKAIATTKWRDIAAPSMELKRRQRWILDNILSDFTPLECVHGFVKGRTIKTNAQCHVNQNEIGCLDIRDFFPSIGIERVKYAYISLGYSEELSEELARLTTYQGRLPQGAPTSPAISNIVMKPIDLEIMKYADVNNLVYSRYADDITISGKQGVAGHLCKIIAIIEENGFDVNEKKTRVMTSASGKKVTGLSVDTRVKVPQKFKRKLRQEIYYCNKFGVTFHLNNSVNPDDRGINFMGYLYGKAYFIRMIEPEVGEDFIRELDYLFDCEE